MLDQLNTVSLDTLCASLCYALGIAPPECAAPANPVLNDYIDQSFGAQKADRVFMYNPDAVAQWIYEKYPQLVAEVTSLTDLALPLRAVMPSVTPVCFGTMYTGAQPAVHGIRKYEKPVIRIDTIFDALLRAGKKVCIIAFGTKCSLSNIFLEREMDYFFCSSLDAANAKAAEVILEDRHDFIVLYNGNYDAAMHKCGPEGLKALAELRSNSHTFAMIDSLIRTHWKHHRTLVGFAMDHGCHEIDDECGSHGLDMPEDLNILHRYKAHCGE